MFGARRKTVIAKGLKIEGRVTAEGLVELNGQIEGELHGKSLIISRGALVKGAVSADQVVVDGSVEAITGGEISPVSGLIFVPESSTTNLPATIRDQPCPLPQGDDPTGPHRLAAPPVRAISSLTYRSASYHSQCKAGRSDLP